MSRLHTGSLQPFLRPTAIDEGAAPAALLGLDDCLRLEMAVPDGFPLVLADPGLLERILANLFSNALRYSPPARPPELHAELVDDTVLLEVVDHGPGVPDEQKERVFEPFSTYPSARVGQAAARPLTRAGDRHPGVGLGLAVAKGFAEAMGGRIRATDTPGGGLRSRSRSRWRAERCRRSARGHDARARRRRRASILRALRINLTARGYDVSTAVDGTRAGHGGPRPPRRVILDLGLPDMDGAEVIHGVRGWTCDPDHRPVRVGTGEPEGSRARRRRRRLCHQAVRDGRAARPAARGGPPGAPAPDEPVIATADFTMDLAAKRVSGRTGGVRLTPTEWQLLEIWSATAAG